MAAGRVTRRRRAKQEQPTLVIMPDGHSLCFAVKETVAHSKPAPHGQALTQHKDVDAHINGLAESAPSNFQGAGSSQHHQSSDPRLAPAVGPTAREPNEGALESGIHATLPGSTTAQGS